jgi:hypothetical protein
MDSTKPSILLEVPDMNMKALQSVEMLQTACAGAAARRHTPDGLIPQKHRCQNFRPGSERYTSDTHYVDRSANSQHSSAVGLFWYKNCRQSRQYAKTQGG